MRSVSQSVRATAVPVRESQLRPRPHGGHQSWLEAARWACLVALALATQACGGSNLVNTARSGDLQTLRAQIIDGQNHGTLDEAEVVAVARAVAGREVRSANQERAVDRIHQVRACAGSLRNVLEDRAGTADDAGAEAQLALIDAGFDRRPSFVSKYSRAESGAWRAVGARLTNGLAHAGLRQQLMSDGDERVRRAAIAASRDASDARDIESLLESTRVDPDPLSRSLAARAAGNLGGEVVVQGLKDVWATADESTRVTIVEAWAMPAAFRSGGEAQLLTVVETGEAMPAVSAAGALVRARGETAQSGAALLSRVASQGPTAERSLALQWLPLADADALKIVQKSAKDPDPKVQAGALGRLLETAHRKDAKRQLLKLAEGKSDAAFPARLILARAGVQEVAVLLKADLKAKASYVREQAAVALAELKQYASAATALADENPSVRTRVACSILLASR